MRIDRFIGHDRDDGLAPQFRQQVVVISTHRLFAKLNFEGLEAAKCLQGLLKGPALIRINTYGNIKTNSLTDLPYARSEEHTSELQSRENLVCRLLLEKKKR